MSPILPLLGTLLAIATSTGFAAAQAPLAPPRQLQRVGEFTVGEGNYTKLLAVSGDGDTLAGLSHGNELLVFALDTGEITARRVMHSRTCAIALSPDGKRLAALSTHLDVIDLGGGTTQRMLRAGGNRVAWSRSGSTLAAQIDRTTIAVFRGKDLARDRDLELPPKGWVREMTLAPGDVALDVIVYGDGLYTFSLPDGARRKVASGNFTAAMRAGDGRWRITFDQRTEPQLPANVTSLGRSQLLAASGCDQYIVGERRTATWFSGERALSEVPRCEVATLHPEGKFLALATPTHLELRAPGGGAPRELRGYRASPGRVAVSHDGRQVLAFARGDQSELTTFDVAARATRATRLEAAFHELLTRPGASQALLVGRTAVQAWDPGAGKVTARFPAPRFHAGPAWSPDGRWLWTGMTTGVTRLGEVDEVHDLPAARTVTIARPHGAHPLAWSRDGGRLALADVLPDCFGGGTLTLYVTEDGRVTAQTGAERFHGPIRAEWSPDGRQLAVTSTLACRILDSNTLEEIGRGPGSHWVRYVDDRHLAGSMGSRVVLWRASDGQIVVESPLRAGQGLTQPPDPLLDDGLSPLSLGDALADTLAIADTCCVHVFRIVR